MAAVDVNGANALHHLCRAQRDAELIDLTLAMIPLLPPAALNMAPIDGQLRGQTPLHIVAGGRDAERRRHEVIKLLIECRANTEARDLNHRTPFLLAGGAAFREGAEMLYACGADIHATKPNGRNFADEAKGSNAMLAKWWTGITGKESTGLPKDVRPDMFRREGVSDKRRQRARDNVQRSRAKQPSMSRAVQTGSGSASSQQPDPRERVVLTERRSPPRLRLTPNDDNHHDSSEDDVDPNVTHILTHVDPDSPIASWAVPTVLAARGAASRSREGRNRDNDDGHNRVFEFVRYRDDTYDRDQVDHYDTVHPWRNWGRDTSRRDRQNDNYTSRHDRRNDNDAWRSGRRGWQDHTDYGSWTSSGWQSHGYQRHYEGNHRDRGYHR